MRQPKYQTKAVEYVTGYLEKKLGTEVSIGGVDIKFFKTAVFTNILFLDQKSDTLLYASELNVRISLFDILNSKVILESVDLKNATVNMLRRKDDPDFNYFYVIDAFASSDTSKSSSGSFDLNLSDLNLTNIKYRYLDAKNSLDLRVQVPSFNTHFNKLDINQPLLDIKSSIMQNAIVDIAMLPDSLSSKPLKGISNFIDTAFVHLNTKSFAMKVSQLEMRNIKFKYDVLAAKEDSNLFDYKHMKYDSINIIVKNGEFIGDSIKGKLLQLSFQEKSGLMIDSMKADFICTPTKSILDNLLLKTQRSRISDRVEFTYYNFPAFYDFTNEVRMNISLINSSSIELRDIACFAPVLNNFESPFVVEGKLRGTVSNLKAKKIILSSGKNTKLEGDISFVGLPNIDETFIDFITTNTSTNYNDLSTIYPSIQLPENIKELGTMSFNGSFTGFINDFVAYGALQSDLGLLQSDLNMKHIDEPAKANYSGSLKSNGINLGKFLQQDSLFGKIAFNARVSGKGITANSIDAIVLSTVSRFDFKGYSYSDIDVNGVIQKKLFTGKLNTNDPNIKLDFQGTIDFNNELPFYKFYATLDSVNLKELKFSKADYILSSRLQFNMKGNTIDNLTGDAHIFNTKIIEEEKQFKIDKIDLLIQEDETRKEINIQSDYINVDVRGKIDLVELPSSFVTIIAHYFPSLPFDYRISEAKQNIDYTISTKNIDPFLKFFYPEIVGGNEASITGSFNSDRYAATLEANIPYLKYLNYEFRKTTMQGSNILNKIFLNINLDSLIINEKSVVKAPSFITVIENNQAVFNLKTDNPKDSIKVDLTGLLIGGKDSVTFSLKPSDIILKGVAWNIKADNKIVYGKNYLRLQDLILFSNNQSVKVYSNLNQENKTVVKLEFTDMDINTFYKYIRLGGYDAAGKINGRVDIINPLEDLRLDGDITITKFVFNGDTINSVAMKANYDIKKDKITCTIKTRDYKYDLLATGSISPKAEENQLDLKIEVLKFKLNILNKYLGEYVSSIDGFTGGTLTLTGNIDKPILLGSLSIPSCVTKINYLQTTYSFKDEIINFYESFIDLGEVTLFDSLKNKATLGGEIFHNNLSDFNLNLFVNTERFQMLHTTSKDNSLFYGDAIINGLISFKGPIDNMEINANVKSMSGTKMSIPITDETTVSENETIRFVNKQKPNLKPQFKVNDKYLLSLNFDLELTTDAEVKIIFDQKAGDIISGRGDGNIRLEIKTNGDFNMYGDYTISEGDYLFTLENLINKKLKIAKGGTISWSGDPYQARINIDAIYSVRAASIANLIPEIDKLSAAEQQEVKRKIPVDLYLKLSGSLLQPNVAFDIKMQSGNGSFSSRANQEIDRIKLDESELNKQVFGLLILNNFIPGNVNFGTVGGGVNTSVSEFIFNQLSYWASQNKLDLGVNLNYNAYTADGTVNSEEGNVKRREFIVGLQKSFLNGRLTIDAGGNIDVSNASATNNSNRVAADVNVQYKITSDGRYTLNAYNKSQYDVILDNNRSKRGISFSYNKEFDDFKELFSKKKKS